MVGTIEAPAGRHLAVYSLPKGRYCLRAKEHLGLCLSVVEGKSNYGGALRRSGDSVVLSYEPGEARAEYEMSYPEVARGHRFVAGSAFQERGTTCLDALPAGNPTTTSSAVPGTFTRPIVRGSLPKAAIRQVLRTNHAAFKQCYEQVLKATPTLAGRLVVKFVIDPRGAVEKATVVSDTVASAEMAECIRTTTC